MYLILKDDNRRRHLFNILAGMIRLYGWEYYFASTKQEKTGENIKFMLFATSLASTEVRSSLADLADIDKTAAYSDRVTAVGSAFEIMRTMVEYLISVEDPAFTPHEIVRIHENLSSAFGETISYLRDSWDAATVATLDDQNLDHYGRLVCDASLLASTQALGFWLQEDEAQRSDACGIIDVLLGLWREGLKSDIRYEDWIAPLVDILIDSSDCKDDFISYNGVELVRQSLRSDSDPKIPTGQPSAQNIIDIKLSILAKCGAGSWSIQSPLSIQNASKPVKG